MRHRFFFVLKKLLRMALLLLGVSIVTFTLMCASPWILSRQTWGRWL